MAKILVVEDDLGLNAGLCFELDLGGHLTVGAYSCHTARQLVPGGAFDLAILDVNLPDGSGFALCQQIKALTPGLPVIFLTANDLEQDILAGYDLGAEDYITKPFNLEILKCRVQVALRRGAQVAPPTADRFDDGFLQVDFAGLTARRGGRPLAITPNEYKLLRVLTANPGNVITRRQLLEKLWDNDGNFIDDHTLTVAMNRLRAKIEGEGRAYIKTVRGMGYLWAGAQS